MNFKCVARFELICKPPVLYMLGQVILCVLVSCLGVDR